MKDDLFEVVFPGGKRVDVKVGAHVIRTDQPASGGGGDTAPAPFDLFLASIGACAGIYVVGFCGARGLSPEGIHILQRSTSDDSGRLRHVELEIVVPTGFPEKYVEALARAAEQCKVKRTLASPPDIFVRAHRQEAA
ncbi:MAG TPA: OsmC family protein [Myxococcales bacterium]|nr:OsmC family protein [Myxococcales bacterium]